MKSTAILRRRTAICKPGRRALRLANDWRGRGYSFGARKLLCLSFGSDAGFEENATARLAQLERFPFFLVANRCHTLGFSVERGPIHYPRRRLSRTAHQHTICKRVVLPAKTAAA